MLINDLKEKTLNVIQMSKAEPELGTAQPSLLDICLKSSYLYSEQCVAHRQVYIRKWYEN